MENFRERLATWMQGRYGGDELSRSLLCLAVASWAIGLLFNSSTFAALAIVPLAVSAWRALSRDGGKRAAENERYQDAVSGPKRNASQAIARIRNRKTTLYFKCKGCKTWLSVPRGKGKLRVVCPNCKRETFRKS